MTRILLPLLGCLLLFAAPLHAIPTDEIAPGRFTITVDGHAVTVPLASNADPYTPNPDRTRLMIYIQDGSRRCVNTGMFLRNACFQSGNLPQTIIAGPQFLLFQDYDYWEEILEDDVAWWGAQNWIYGSPSDSSAALPRPAVASSYTITDSLIAAYYTSNPQLEAITLFGESAGGKFISRYAAVSRIYDMFPDIPLYLVSVNSGSFMYFSEDRPGLDDQFRQPGAVVEQWIPKWNHYPYGLVNLNQYASVTDESDIANRFSTRAIFLLVGELDHGLNADDKPMHMQGMTNLLRNIYFDQYLAFLYGDQPYHTLTIYPDIDHSGHQILMHPDSWGPMFEFVPEVVGVDETPAAPRTELPSTPQLSAHPNPFNSSAQLELTLPTAGALEVAVFNTLGRRVATLSHPADRYASGVHRFTWDAAGQASGVYFVRATLDGRTVASSKLVLTR